MIWKNTSQRYSSVSIGLHWLMFILIVAVYACIELRELYPKGSEMRDMLKTWHFMLGLSVLLLVVVRLAARLVAGAKPAIIPPIAPWQAFLANLVHYALYALMLGLPIAGWLILSSAGKPIMFYGFELPALIAENKALSKQIKEIHETIGTLGYYLIGLHALAALVHHYILADNTLRRMLPSKK